MKGGVVALLFLWVALSRAALLCMAVGESSDFNGCCSVRILSTSCNVTLTSSSNPKLPPYAGTLTIASQPDRTMQCGPKGVQLMFSPIGDSLQLLPSVMATCLSFPSGSKVGFATLLLFPPESHAQSRSKDNFRGIISNYNVTLDAQR